jgi:hypothetical protein
VVQYFVASGFYVVIDYHAHPGDETVINTVPGFMESWRRVWADLTCLPNWSTDLKVCLWLGDSMGIGDWDLTAFNRPACTLL